MDSNAVGASSNAHLSVLNDIRINGVARITNQCNLVEVDTQRSHSGCCLVEMDAAALQHR
jgi:hypothetical protein